MKNKKYLYLSLCAFASFWVWTALLYFVDVKPVGAEGTDLGFSTVNLFFHGLTGVNMFLYRLTDVLSLIPLGFVCGFALQGLCQWIKRKSLLKADADLLMLGGFYIAVAAVYIVFEIAAVNYRPLLIDGRLEASYPSSTTVLTACVMPAAAIQLKRRIKRKTLRKWTAAGINAFTVFMIAARFISGVHWATDIAGGILISVSLVCAYKFCVNLA